MRNTPHARHNGDIHLAMSEKPEQVLPDEGRAAGMRLHLITDDYSGRDKEAGSGRMIEDEQEAGGHEYGESGQTHAGGDKPCPSAQRQAPQAHAASSHIERGGDEVQCAEQLANAEQSYGGSP